MWATFIKCQKPTIFGQEANFDTSRYENGWSCTCVWVRGAATPQPNVLGRFVTSFEDLVVAEMFATSSRWKTNGTNHNIGLGTWCVLEWSEIDAGVIECFEARV